MLELLWVLTALAGLEQSLKWNKEVNIMKAMLKLLCFSKCLARHSFPCVGIMTVKTTVMVSEKSR